MHVYMCIKNQNLNLDYLKNYKKKIIIIVTFELTSKNADNPDDKIQSVVDSIVNNAKNLDNIKVWFILKRRFDTQHMPLGMSYRS